MVINKVFITFNYFLTFQLYGYQQGIHYFQLFFNPSIIWSSTRYSLLSIIFLTLQ